jgi:hypothetical protein
MAKRKRNYRKEYDDYQGKPASKKARARRNRDAKKLKCPAGQEAHHPAGNARGKARCVSKKSNRKMQSRRRR